MLFLLRMGVHIINDFYYFCRILVLMSGMIEIICNFIFVYLLQF